MPEYKTLRATENLQQFEEELNRLGEEVGMSCLAQATWSSWRKTKKVDGKSRRPTQCQHLAPPSVGSRHDKLREFGVLANPEGRPRRKDRDVA